MPLKDSELGEILLKLSYVSEEDLKKAMDVAKERQAPLKVALFEMELLTQEIFEGAMAEHYKLPFYDIRVVPPNPDLVGTLPEEIARQYAAVLVKREGDAVTVATADPGNPFLEEALRLNIDQKSSKFP
ncbi:hypothetical protein EXS70_01080 [Candidatus Peribacteria bacterium]|nr:hypothetical protein [Candidatus Peribacteria bacterium]